MSNREANTERYVRSIETRLRGQMLTRAQAERIATAARIAAATDSNDAEPETGAQRRRTWISPPSLTTDGDAFYNPFAGGGA